MNLDDPCYLNPGYLESSNPLRSHSPAVFKNKIGKNSLKSDNNLIFASKDKFENMKESEKNTLDI